MPYHVRTVDEVVAYLRDYPGISEAAREALVNGYLTDLAERAEHFLARDPLGHESLLFSYEFSFIDGGAATRSASSRTGRSWRSGSSPCCTLTVRPGTSRSDSVLSVIAL